MGSDVADKVTGPGEGLVTGGARKGLISCVCPLVTLHGIRPRESLVTLVTWIRFLPGVSYPETQRRTLYTWSRSKERIQCVSSREYSCYQNSRKPCHTGDKNKVSPHYGFSGESSSDMTGKRTVYTRSRSKESRHCVSFGVSSGFWSRRKSCHTGGRLWAVLQYGSVCVTLSLKTQKTTSDRYCIHKASPLNESDCEFLVYWS